MIDAPILIAQACVVGMRGRSRPMVIGRGLVLQTSENWSMMQLFLPPLRSSRDCGRGRSCFPRMFDTYARRSSAPMLARASAAVSIRRSP